MSVLPVGFGSAAGGTPAGAIERSLRFNSADSPSLTRTPSVSGSRTTFTHSMWVKRTALSSLSFKTLYGSESSGSNYVNCAFYQDTIYWTTYDGATNITIQTSQVFRDVSSWYHIVIAVDTTQATDSNRVRLYVNGSRITAGTFNYPTQDQTLQINTASFPHKIGFSAGFGQYFDGYMTEINFLDGYPTVGGTPYNATTWAALNVSTLFGETDTNTGVWKPKAYSGTYGTNGFYLPFKTASNWSGYFDGSNDYLSVDSNAAWQYGTGDFCVEGWFFGTTSGSLSNQYLFGRYNTSVSAYGALQLANSTSFYWYYGNGGAYGFTLGTALTTNRWYHVAVSRSGTSLRFFLDGTQVGSTQTDNTNYGGTAEFRIINAHQSSATYFPGYISNVRVVKGSAVYTSNFTPSTSQLTAITNTVLLTCQSSTFVDNSTNAFTITNNGGALNQQFSPFALDVTDDHSGTGNNLQPNNLDLRTTGVGADILVDSPTSYGTDTGVGGEVRGNYCTMNPLTVPTLPTLANGNLDVSVSATGVKIAQGTFQFPSSGKWYYECTFNNASSGVNGMFIGITSPTRGPNATRSTAGAYFFYASSSALLNSNGTDVVTGLSTISANEVFKLAVDIDNSKVWIGRGSNWYNSSGGTTGDPAAGTNPTFSISAIGLTPMAGFDASSVSLSMNFGQRAFSYTAPSGFKALCTQNFTTPTIGATSTTLADDYFNVKLYSGNGNTGQTITGVGFQPDFVWLKNRNQGGGYPFFLYDAVRGAGYGLRSNATNAEENRTAVFSAFASDGFTFPAGQGNTLENDAAGTYASWNWNAGGSNATNTAGTITSTVRANTTSGFSIISYTGNKTSGATIGHGLGVAPAMVIIKERANASEWIIYHTSLGATKSIYFTAAQENTNSIWFNNTAPSSTVITLGNSDGTNRANTMIAYAFAPVAGYSAFGSYASNNSADNAFVYCGFRPRWIMIKSSSTGGTNYDWLIFDTARMSYNYIANTDLRANLTTTEGGTARNPPLDILSNGFKVRGSGGEIGSSTTYIFAAFAETPFKYALAR